MKHTLGIISPKLHNTIQDIHVFDVKQKHIVLCHQKNAYNPDREPDNNDILGINIPPTYPSFLKIDFYGSAFLDDIWSYLLSPENMIILDSMRSLNEITSTHLQSAIEIAKHISPTAYNKPQLYYGDKAEMRHNLVVLYLND